MMMMMMMIIWKMRWSITFYETQTKQSDIFPIFSVICVGPFKQLINSTVTKLAGSVTLSVVEVDLSVGDDHVLLSNAPWIVASH